MSRKSKNINFFRESDPIQSKVEPVIDETNYIEEVKEVKEDVLTLGVYLANYSPSRNIDIVIKKWFQSQDVSNPKKTKSEWDTIIQSFFNEKEKK